MMLVPARSWIRRRSSLWCVSFGLLGLGHATAQAGLSLTGGGLTLVQEGPVADAAGGAVPTNLATGKTPFGSGELGPDLGIDYHLITNLNDGFYGNGFSWIGGNSNPYPLTFAGIDFGAAPLSNIQSIAFGRSNVLSGDPCAGVCTDRHLGLYELQYTQVANPSTNLDLDVTGNAATGWAGVGTLDYGTSDGAGTNYNSTWIRHRYNFDAVSATGVRLVVPGTGIGGGTAIDEIEIFDKPGDFVPPPPPPEPVVIKASPGFQIAWNGNNGVNFDSEAPPDGAKVPNNVALATQGAIPFTSSDLGPELGIPFHAAVNINDGFYGNANSWIGGTDNPFSPIQFAGVRLATAQPIGEIAFGRDNGNDTSDACGGQCTDRSLGLYTLQRTLVANADADTPDTGNPDTGWQTIGTLNYRANDGTFTSYLRHQYQVAATAGPLMASAVRILVPSTGLNGGTAIDEIEIYGSSASPADFDHDGDIDLQDVNLMTAAIRGRANPAAFDLDNNQRVVFDDLWLMIHSHLHTWMGDANLDGEFNSTDLVVVFQGGEYEDAVADNSGWEEGDWDGDGDFTSSDLIPAFQDGGFERGPAQAVSAIPEPTGVSLFGAMSLGLVSWLRGRRRK